MVLLDLLVLDALDPLASLVQEVPLVILVYKERLVLEGFPVCPGYQGLVVTQDPRETEVLRVTQVLLELVMKDPQDLRDQMELLDLQVLVSLVLRVSEVLLASKVSECS